MASKRQHLGSVVKSHREHKEFTQENVANNCDANVSRTAVAHLEQGIRVPRPEVLSAICSYLDIPESEWKPFTREESLLRFRFEEHLSEFVGKSVNIDAQDIASQRTAEDLISRIFQSNPSSQQLIAIFNSILVYYGVGPVSEGFFSQYFNPSSFGSTDAFCHAVEEYQMDAIRLFPTFAEAFDTLNKAENVDAIISPLQPHPLDDYQARTEWTLIEQIQDELLPDLGYISAQRVRQEAAERKWLIEQLVSLAECIRSDGTTAIATLGARVSRKIDSLLRKFGSTIEHGVSSTLFQPDPDSLKREAARLAPRTEEELKRMEDTQQIALRNLSRYLAADHMDVYVATSMRTAADYISVNHFVSTLFSHELIRPLKLRYFNPTQSWIDDRVAKGLVEALMLKRATVTIYMAQKTDTFGKDSEASVALGQGKPVIVYVPKLVVGETIDSEKLLGLERADLVARYNELPEEDNADETMDNEALVAWILATSLEKRADEEICDCARRYWADFDLYSEAERFEAPLREEYRAWLDRIVADSGDSIVPENLRAALIGALVATAVNFEKRARLFREVHPLALQVILSTGVLNGIHVARTVQQCATVLAGVIGNKLELASMKDEDNYRVVEKTTGSTIRVISRNELLFNAFSAHYRRVQPES